MQSYRYREVSQVFVDELTQLLVDGQSAVLLSPRFIGKRYVALHVRYRLRNCPEAGPIVDVRWLSDRPFGTREQAIQAMNEAVGHTARSIGLQVAPGKEMFDAIDELHAKTGKIVILLAANVDAMGHHLARTFLQEAQRRVEARTVVVLLGGEEDFRDMVRGPTSDFRCANVFVLQRFAREEFDAFLLRYARAMHIKFESKEDACDYFFALTGGHTYLLRRALWQLTENRALFERKLPGRIKVQDIDALLESNEVGSVRYSEPLLYATRMIAREPECWEPLKSLMSEGSLGVDFLGSQPSTLELAGVAVFDNGRLRFSSKLMEDFIRQHYDERRFGDLYARHGEWTEAFKRYARLPDEMFLRPSGVEDRMDMEFTVAALHTALRSAATQSSSEVMARFEHGCWFLLALRVGKFRRPPYGKRWQADPETAALISGPVQGIDGALAGLELRQPGPVPLPGSWGDYAVAAFVPALRTDEQAAVVVGNLDGSTTISREQRRLASELLQHFVDAYSFAVTTERDRHRLKARQQHEEIIDAIFKSLGVRILDVGHALKVAASGLRRLGYRRALFCLVDPKGERIKGVLDDSDDSSVDVGKMTDWSLFDDPPQDLQPYVVRTAQPRIIPDASAEPLANKEVVKRARMTGEAIMPIMTADGRVIGTIHVEREDGEVPSQDEVEDLMAFGRRLAVAIDQAHRVNLLQAAINQSPDPVVIVDARQRVQYANKPAGDLFGLPSGWNDLPSGWCDGIDSPQAGGTDLAEARGLLDDALHTNHRQFRHTPRIARESDCGAAVLADVIQDWRPEVVGAFVHVQYLRDLRGVLEACQVIARAHDTDSAIQAILDATSALGHRWGRLYLLSEDEPQRMVGRRAFGFDDPTASDDFSAGRVVLLPRDQASPETWLCVDRREPCVFAWKDECPGETTFQTSKGLTVLNAKDSKCPETVRKRPGDFWIDFPLLTSTKVLGKITLQCDEDMLPERHELLRVLSRLSSSLLDAFSERDEAFRRRADSIREVAERTLATAAHNINTRIAGLSALSARYALHESKYEPLKSLDADFEHVLRETMDTIGSIKRKLAPVKLRLERFDLVERLRRAIPTTLSEASWDLCAEPPIEEIEADGHLLEMAFLELVDNSVQAAGSREAVRLHVSVQEESISGKRRIRVTFADEGPGIPFELKERVFDDFVSYRPGRDTSLGLGLGFVRRLIQAHGGTIRECGQPGAGAKFLIDIPPVALPINDE